jgi:hypothetical protein
MIVATAEFADASRPIGRTAIDWLPELQLAECCGFSTMKRKSFPPLSTECTLPISLSSARHDVIGTLWLSTFAEYVIATSRGESTTRDSVATVPWAALRTDDCHCQD